MGVPPPTTWGVDKENLLNDYTCKSFFLLVIIYFILFTLTCDPGVIVESSTHG